MDLSVLLLVFLKIIIAFFVLKLYIFIGFKIMNYFENKKQNKEGDKKNV